MARSLVKLGLPPEGVCDPESEESEAVGQTLLFRFNLATELREAIQLPAELANKALACPIHLG
jgi:hypothetical protein